jgi:hypothetical protein
VVPKKLSKIIIHNNLFTAVQDFSNPTDIFLRVNQTTKIIIRTPMANERAPTSAQHNYQSHGGGRTFNRGFGRFGQRTTTNFGQRFAGNDQYPNQGDQDLKQQSELLSGTGKCLQL